MKLELIRQHHVKSHEGGHFQTLGTLLVKDKDDKIVFECKTLELPWRDNKKYISCFPPAPQQEATYNWVTRNSSPSFSYAHIHIQDVPGRTNILVHRGNWIGPTPEESHSLGCVLVGSGFAYVNEDGYLDVIDSRNTMTRLMSMLPNKGTITVKWWLQEAERADSRMFANQFLSRSSVKTIIID
jgi:hypothetical protein